MADTELPSQETPTNTDNPSMAKNSSTFVTGSPSPSLNTRTLEQTISTNPTTIEPSTPPTQQPLSKNAQKKLAKAAYRQGKKLEWRARERAAKKEKKRLQREREYTQAQAQAHATTTKDRGQDGAEDAADDGQPARKKVKHSRSGSGSLRLFKARVVIDLGFDSYMSDKEISSLNSQLAFCYSANRRATRPFETILFTSLNGRLKSRLEVQDDAGYKRWARCEWWEDGYERLWSDDPDPPAQEESSKSSLVEEISSESQRGRTRSEQERVVYLTADADDELEELKEGETYILGGIVDRNRYKFLCQKKATASGIRTARLPIGKYLAEMKTRKVLTVNQVFEILVHWNENRNWEEAIYSVMPKRKFIQQSTKPAATDGSTMELEETEEVAEGADDGSSPEEADRSKDGDEEKNE